MVTWHLRVKLFPPNHRSGQHCENYDVKQETVHCYRRNVDRCCTSFVNNYHCFAIYSRETKFTYFSPRDQSLSVNCFILEYALCGWGHVTTFFLENLYIMGYNLKNTRNGKSSSKIPKWPSLWPPSLGNKNLWQSGFFWGIRRFVWKKVLVSSNIFHRNPLNFPTIQVVV